MSDNQLREASDPIYFHSRGSLQRGNDVNPKIQYYNKIADFGPSLTVSKNPRIVTVDVAQATTLIPGALAVATQPEVDAGLINTKAVTPLTLANYSGLGGGGGGVTASYFDVTGNGVTIPSTTTVVFITNTFGTSISNTLQPGSVNGQSVTLLQLSGGIVQFDNTDSISNIKGTGNYDCQVETPHTFVWENTTLLWYQSGRLLVSNP